MKLLTFSSLNCGEIKTMQTLNRLQAWKRYWLIAGVCGCAAVAQADQPEPVPLPPASRQREGAEPRAQGAKRGGTPKARDIVRAQPGETVAIDLDSTLQLAGVRNPHIMIARQRVTETLAIRQFAAAQILPNLNAGANYDTHTGPVQQSSSNLINVDRSALYVGAGANAIAAGSVNIPGVMWNQNLSQSLFTFLTARQTVRQQQFTSDATRNRVLLSVALAYVELLRAAGHLAIAVRIRDDAAEVARITAAYATAGQGRQADADRAATELGKRETDLMVSEGELLMASARLAQLINVEPTIRFQPTEAWVVPMPLVPEPITLQELIAMAALRRPELAAQREAIRVALLNLQGARVLPFSPTLLVGFSGGDFGGGSNLTPPRFGNFGGRDDFDAIAFWTLQNMGVGNAAQISLSRSRLRQQDLRRLEVLNTVRREVADGYTRSQVRLAQLARTERAVRSAIQAFDEDMLRIRNTPDTTRPIEVLDSLRLLGRARFDYLDAISQYNAAQFELYVALGQPPANALARPAGNNAPANGDNNTPQGMPVPPPDEAPPEAQRPVAPQLTAR
jgi:outer membrane protein TolC